MTVDDAAKPETTTLVQRSASELRGAGRGQRHAVRPGADDRPLPEPGCGGHLLRRVRGRTAAVGAGRARPRRDRDPLRGGAPRAGGARPRARGGGAVGAAGRRGVDRDRGAGVRAGAAAVRPVRRTRAAVRAAGDGAVVAGGDAADGADRRHPRHRPHEGVRGGRPGHRRRAASGAGGRRAGARLRPRRHGGGLHDRVLPDACRGRPGGARRDRHAAAGRAPSRPAR